MKQKKFDWGYFLKHIAIIAVPVALQNLLTTTGSMVDTIMLASIGEKAVGAIGPVLKPHVFRLLGLHRRRHALLCSVLGSKG